MPFIVWSFSRLVRVYKQLILVSTLLRHSMSTKAERDAHNRPSAPVPAHDTLPFMMASTFQARELSHKGPNKPTKYW